MTLKDGEEKELKEPSNPGRITWFFPFVESPDVVVVGSYSTIRGDCFISDFVYCAQMFQLFSKRVLLLVLHIANDFRIGYTIYIIYLFSRHHFKGGKSSYL